MYTTTTDCQSVPEKLNEDNRDVTMDFNNSGSSEADPFAPPLCRTHRHWVMSQVVVAVVLILIIVSNVLVLLVVARDIQSRIINAYFFSSLAMSDLLTGVLILPFHLAFAVQEDSAAPGFLVCTFSGVMFHILQTVSLFSFFALSLDRCLAVHFPLTYQLILTTKVNLVILALIWGLPTLMYGLIPATGAGQYVFKCWQSMCNLGPVNMTYLTVLMLTCVVVFVATYALNGRVFYIAKQHRDRISSAQMADNCPPSQSLRSLKIYEKVKAARCIVTALGLFTLCWGPYYTTLFCLVLFGTPTTPLTQFALLWVAISNSFMNLFVFLTTNRSFRMQFLRIFRSGGNRVEHSNALSYQQNVRRSALSH